MFLKIFKHAFLRSLKTVITLLVISLIAGTLSGIAQKVRQTTKNAIVFSLSSTIHSLFSLGVSILAFACILVIISNFYKAVATDEAYFTYTLPAKTKTQMGARYLSILAWLVIVAVVTLVSKALVEVFANGFKYFKIYLPTEITADLVWSYIEGLLLGIIIPLSVIAHAMFGVLFANALSVKLKRRLSNFIVGLIFFFEMLCLLAILIILLVIHVNHFGIYATSHYVSWTFIVIISGLGVLAYFLAYKLMGRWLNIA